MTVLRRKDPLPRPWTDAHSWRGRASNRKTRCSYLRERDEMDEGEGQREGAGGERGEGRENYQHSHEGSWVFRLYTQTSLQRKVARTTDKYATIHDARET